MIGGIAVTKVFQSAGAGVHHRRPIAHFLPQAGGVFLGDEVRFPSIAGQAAPSVPSVEWLILSYQPRRFSPARHPSSRLAVCTRCAN